MSINTRQKRLELIMVDTLDIMADIWAREAYASVHHVFEIISIEPELRPPGTTATDENKRTLTAYHA